MPHPRSWARARWILLALLVLAATACGRAGGDPFQPTQTSPVQIPVDGTVAQTVNPAGGEVAAVDVQVATYGQTPDRLGRLRVSLRDPEEGDELGVAEVLPEDLADLAWVTARFDPPVEVGDVVLVETSWDGETPLALLANVPDPAGSQERSSGGTPQAPRRALPNDPYEDGELVVNGRPIVGDLAFRVRGGGGPAAALEQVGEVLASAGNRAVEAPVFAIGWVAALLGAIALAVWGLRRADG